MRYNLNVVMVLAKQEHHASSKHNKPQTSQQLTRHHCLEHSTFPWSRSMIVVVSYSCWNVPMTPCARYRSFSDHPLSMYALKIKRQQRKGDRITSKVIRLFSKDLICLKPLQWQNLSQVRFTYPSRFWFDSALILCGQTADLFFVAKPHVSQQVISTH